MWTDLSNRKYEDLKNYSAVFIGGGNTFRLLDFIRKSGFDQLLLRYIRSDKPVFGGSAGAIILGRDIGTAFFGEASDKNEVGIKDLTGLNVANGYSIACHHSKAYDKKVIEYSSNTKIPTIALSENTGLYINDDEIRVFGSRSAIVFNGKIRKIIKVGSKIE
ncbi:MAG: Type 1 glutamine amidotransferase-like domain-containing protein, partial [Candidatus Micrarchaeia archaeon]